MNNYKKGDLLTFKGTPKSLYLSFDPKYAFEIVDLGEKFATLKHVKTRDDNKNRLGYIAESYKCLDRYWIKHSEDELAKWRSLKVWSILYEKN